ncbi:bifunctional protein-disulfide isomerase/oxidoreductase DsbC [Vibrio cholerae]|nr:bifunctional protein-disulfide isomerase/oxidoreductase DsbC [Vibrio cholerae]EKF9572142.1 bifunctional protein-disulfide isomerase/oxidoreductase DsbC [Vibrio cholerae]
MSVLRRLTWLAFPLLSIAFNVQANTAPAQLNKAELEQRFAKLGLQVEEIKPSDINGLLEVQTSGGVLFSSPDGEHFIAGTLYALDGNGGYVDVLAKRQAPLNAKKIAALQDSMIEFKAPNEKYAITVFTDITCGYCVRLHSQIKEYNDLGITVRYLAYPRQGPQGQVADQMAAIWCSNDPKAAMHDTKVNRKTITADKDIAQCQKTIAQHYMLGHELGISGTPAIFLPNGEMVGGYLPAPQLLQRLQATQ